MNLACESLGVEMHEINPDGHCLYSSIADQLALQGLSGSTGVKDYHGARRITAQFMRQHKDDFAPFISDSDERMAGIENPEAGSQQSGNAEKQLESEYTEMQDWLVCASHPSIVVSPYPSAADGKKDILAHPFLLLPSRFPFSPPEHYMDYCNAIETTSVWGGQPEILAMSRALHTPIWVVQAGQPVVKVGQEEAKPGQQPLLISYHRRMYGLGEVSYARAL